MRCSGDRAENRQERAENLDLQPPIATAREGIDELLPAPAQTEPNKGAHLIIVRGYRLRFEQVKRIVAELHSKREGTSTKDA